MLATVVLAAGKGTRMRSDQPKVLHQLGAKPLLTHVVETATQLADGEIFVVHGYAGERVRASLNELAVTWIEQSPQLGTGHALAQVLPHIDDASLVLVLYGDVPLLAGSTLRRLLDAASDDTVALLTVELDEPSGYGRIVRDAAGSVQRITEQKDASPQECAIREINTGVMAAPAKRLRRWVAELGNANAQGEYYLTDVIALAVADGCSVMTSRPACIEEVMGVNDRAQLAVLERFYQRQQARDLMLAGTTLIDPERFDLRGRLTVGRDVVIDINVVLEGSVELGDRVIIGPNNVLKNCSIGDDVTILPNSVVEDARIGSGCRVGPFSRIRPGTELSDDVHVGNFVEIKKSTVASGSKINHLSYVGDATVGRKVNIGAGTITCNYDGANKHKTVIGDRVFIGSDTQLVAPVTLGEGSTIGAGSTITRDTPAEKLTLSRRNPQTTLRSWQRPQKPGK